MPKKKPVAFSWLQTTAIRVTKLHFLYIAACMGALIVFDSWNLLTQEAVAERWTAAGVLLVINSVFWYISRIKFSKDTVYINLLLLLILADIAFAAMTVYWERGLASSSVILFAVPIITAATLRSRSTLLATAALSISAYSISAVRYFYQHYGESFRVELYGELAFYSAIFFVLVGLLWVVVSPRNRI